jgi:hypothetical protein
LVESGRLKGKFERRLTLRVSFLSRFQQDSAESRQRSGGLRNIQNAGAIQHRFGQLVQWNRGEIRSRKLDDLSYLITEESFSDLCRILYFSGSRSGWGSQAGP